MADTSLFDRLEARKRRPCGAGENFVVISAKVTRRFPAIRDRTVAWHHSDQYSDRRESPVIPAVVDRGEDDIREGEDDADAQVFSHHNGL